MVLSKVEQGPSGTVQTALLPVIKELIVQPLVKHSNEDVKVCLATCISEVTKITVPDSPYEDEAMKKAECLQQKPSESMETALLPITSALIGRPPLKHLNEDVKVSVACCISEFVRVAAPDQPYDDEDMKKAECLLSGVLQDPSESMVTALLRIKNALIMQQLLKHPNEDVKLYVVCCIIEYIRVTAPDHPYDDEVMKEVFELTVVALGKLSLGSGSCYSKAVNILHNLANCSSCGLMLDLECNNLIVDMIKLLVGTARLNHSDSVFSDMETVMTTVINESDEISLELLISIIRSMKMENQNDSPLRWKLGENVCKRSAPKIQAYLPRAAELMNGDLNDITRGVLPVLPGVSEREHLVFRKPSEEELVDCVIQVWWPLDSKFQMMQKQSQSLCSMSLCFNLM